MRHVYENQDEAEERGRRIKRFVEKNLSWDTVGKMIIDAIKKMQERIMIALVTTSRSLLALNLGTGEAKEVHTGKGLYFGITYSDELIFVSARNNYDPFEYLDNIDHFSGSVLVFNYELELVTEIDMPTPTTAATLRDLHQIIFLDDKLWLICARDNMIMINDFDKWDYWFPSDNKRERWKDIHHFNSLWIDFDMSTISQLNNRKSHRLTSCGFICKSN